MIIILKDSILKCINNDSDIYFLSQKLKEKTQFIIDTKTLDLIRVVIAPT